MLKILQARLQQYVNCELPFVQAGFRKGRGTRDQIANIPGCLPLGEWSHHHDYLGPLTCSYLVLLTFLSVLRISGKLGIIHFSWKIIFPLKCIFLTSRITEFAFLLFYFSSVHFSHSVMSDSLRPHESQHARPPCSSPTLTVHSDSCPSSQWCHPAISSSVVPFSYCPQSLPASESFPMSQLFIWGGQSTGVSASASFPPKKSQGWSPSEWTGWISLQSKGFSRVFSNTTVQKHQFFGAQPSSQSNYHIHTWPLEKP